MSQEPDLQNKMYTVQYDQEPDVENIMYTSSLYTRNQI